MPDTRGNRTPSIWMGDTAKTKLLNSWIVADSESVLRPGAGIIATRGRFGGPKVRCWHGRLDRHAASRWAKFPAHVLHEASS